MRWLSTDMMIVRLLNWRNTVFGATVDDYSTDAQSHVAGSA